MSIFALFAKQELSNLASIALNAKDAHLVLIIIANG
jgi:hypothetical protein